jgi:hypothetical protein
MTCATTSPTGRERQGGHWKKWRTILGLSPGKVRLLFRPIDPPEQRCCADQTHDSGTGKGEQIAVRIYP